MCDFPRRIPNPRYKNLTPYQKNGILKTYFPGALELPDRYIVIPCGKCVSCQKKRMKTWRHRLLREIPLYHNTIFVTLSISPLYYDSFEGDPSPFIRKFLDNVRKKRSRNKNSMPRHWFISEGGFSKYDTHRYHFHGFLFGLSKKDISFKELRKCWRYGHIWVNNVRSTAAATYTSKYMTKDFNISCRVFCSPHIGDAMLKDLTFDETLGRYPASCSLPNTYYYLPVPQHYSRRRILPEKALIYLRNRYLSGCLTPRYSYQGVFYETFESYRAALLSAAQAQLYSFPALASWMSESSNRRLSFSYYFENL